MNLKKNQLKKKEHKNVDFDDITITNAYEYEGDLFVEGSYFNDYSTVLVNSKKYSTQKINDRLLKVEGASIKDGDIISVAQIDKDGVELSRVIYLVSSNVKESAKDEKMFRLVA